MPAMGAAINARAGVRNSPIHWSTIIRYLLPAGIGADPNDPPGLVTPHVRQENTIDIQRSEDVCARSYVSHMMNGSQSLPALFTITSTCPCSSIILLAKSCRSSSGAVTSSSYVWAPLALRAASFENERARVVAIALSPRARILSTISRPMPDLQKRSSEMIPHFIE